MEGTTFLFYVGTGVTTLAVLPQEMLNRLALTSMEIFQGDPEDLGSREDLGALEDSGAQSAAGQGGTEARVAPSASPSGSLGKGCFSLA